MELQVSVIIPVYNGERWVGDAVRSIVGARGVTGAVELIVVDDGSTDRSAEVAAEAAAGFPRFQLVRQPNAGVSAARNRGISLARGRYLCFVDADDLLHPDALAIMLKIAGSLPEGSIVASRVRRDDTTPRHEKLDNVRYRLFTGLKAVEQGLYRRRLDTSMCGSLIPAALFEGTDRFRPGRYEDLDLFYRIYEQAPRVAVIDVPLYYYRQNQSSFINTVSPSRFDALDVVDRLCCHYSGTKLQSAAQDRAVSASFNMLRLVWTNRLDEPAIERRCLDNIRRYRRRVLLNPQGRLLNKPVLALSVLGTGVLKLILGLKW